MQQTASPRASVTVADADIRLAYRRRVVKLALDLRNLARREVGAAGLANRFAIVRERQFRRPGFFERWNRANEPRSRGW
jgi:hypothetical protein